MKDITIKISDVANGQRKVYIDGNESHHVAEGDVAKILAETRNNRWRTNPDSGAALGSQLHDLLNQGARTLPVDA
ncbi:hypothetical protein MBAV_006362, partial [Candidatus Magnetobacterium bavaricum]